MTSFLMFPLSWMMNDDRWQLFLSFRRFFYTEKLNVIRRQIGCFLALLIFPYRNRYTGIWVNSDAKRIWRVAAGNRKYDYIMTYLFNGACKSRTFRAELILAKKWLSLHDTQCCDRKSSKTPYHPWTVDVRSFQPRMMTATGLLRFRWNSRGRAVQILFCGLIFYGKTLSLLGESG